MASKDELARAIRAKCSQCACGSRKAVNECSIRECALWSYRRGEAAGAQAEEETNGQQIGIAELFAWEEKTWAG